MQRVTFDIHIPADEYLRVYKGSAKAVLVTAHDGRRIQFPANILQPFLLHSGISGRFAIQFDREGKFQNISRIA